MITYLSSVVARPGNGQTRRLNRWTALGVGALLGVVALTATACSSARAVPAHTTAPAPVTTTSTPRTAAAAAPRSTSAPPVLQIVTTRLGAVLADPRGRTIYMYTRDSPGHSACTAACLQSWPIVTAPAITPSAVAAITARLGTLDRADGGRQLTVNGYPIYTFTADTGPGSTAGQGQRLNGGVWSALTPAGAAITTSSPATTPPAAATPPPAAAPSAPTPTMHPSPAHRTPAGFRQNNGGDHDADNNGGPNDGDGTV
jgi:predicted lipoprotein with Yx(FWY)xxD motif